MLPKILILLIHLFAMKMVLSQTVYSVSPTVAYPKNAVSTAQSYPINISPSASTGLPSTLTTSLPMKSSPGLISTCPSIPSTVSPSTEAKAYFLPGPIRDPKVTILGDMPSVVEVKPRLSTESSIMDLNPRADPGFIEVIGKFCDPNNVKHGDISKPVLPTVRENTVSPYKRLTKACSDNEPLLSADSSLFLQNQQSVCPGISKIDFVLGTPALGGRNINNPIEYEGLLDGFLSYLEVPSSG